MPVADVVDWIPGDVTVPSDRFLQLVDIVLDDNRKIIELNRDFLEQVRLRHRR